MNTYSPKASEITREWHVVDAEGMVLGRLATEVARLLRGKHKPIFSPHMDTGDHVIIVNADKIVLTSDKARTKMVYRHSGYPGGIYEMNFAKMQEKFPARVLEKAVKGMLPKGPLGYAMLKKLKCYVGPTHPHAPQQPRPLVLEDTGRMSVTPQATQSDKGTQAS